eukprot:SAG11_NODE_19922_length_456_cov_0.971989_1_plen_27_part_01
MSWQKQWATVTARDDVTVTARTRVVWR